MAEEVSQNRLTQMLRDALASALDDLSGTYGGPQRPGKTDPEASATSRTPTGADPRRLATLLENAAEQLSQQHLRMAELRKAFAQAAQQNIELHRRILAEQTLLKKEMDRLRQRLRQLSTARR